MNENDKCDTSRFTIDAIEHNMYKINQLCDEIKELTKGKTDHTIRHIQEKLRKITECTIYIQRYDKYVFGVE